MMHGSSQTMVPRVAASHRQGIYQECKSLGPELPNLKPQSGAQDEKRKCSSRISTVPGTELWFREAAFS